MQDIVEKTVNISSTKKTQEQEQKEEEQEIKDLIRRIDILYSRGFIEEAHVLIYEINRIGFQAGRRTLN
jgi:hypothetical protein